MKVENGVPIFVSTDVVMHKGHQLTDNNSVRKLGITSSPVTHLFVDIHMQTINWKQEMCLVQSRTCPVSSSQTWEKVSSVSVVASFR